MSIPISIVIFTKNEQSNIVECIKSCLSFSEIVVVDSNSSDRTVELAESFGAKVISFNWNTKYPKKRQWSLENIKYKNEFILFIDADERISPNLQEELEIFMTNYSESFSAGVLSLSYHFAGRQLKFGHTPKKIVLLRLGDVHFPVIDDLESSGMGELEGHYQPIINGKVKHLKNRLVHDDRDPISSWMIRHVNYANWEGHLLTNNSARLMVEKSKGPVAAMLHKLPFRPLSFFIYSYVLKMGFLDGKAGFDYAFAKSWYYWLSGVIARERILKHE